MISSTTSNKLKSGSNTSGKKLNFKKTQILLIAHTGLVPIWHHAATVHVVFPGIRPQESAGETETKESWRGSEDLVTQTENHRSGDTGEWGRQRGEARRHYVCHM